MSYYMYTNQQCQDGTECPTAHTNTQMHLVLGLHGFIVFKFTNTNNNNSKEKQNKHKTMFMFTISSDIMNTTRNNKTKQCESVTTTFLFVLAETVQ